MHKVDIYIPKACFARLAKCFQEGLTVVNSADSAENFVIRALKPDGEPVDVCKEVFFELFARQRFGVRFNGEFGIGTYGKILSQLSYHCGDGAVGQYARSASAYENGIKNPVGNKILICPYLTYQRSNVCGIVNASAEADKITIPAFLFAKGDMYV